MYFPLWGYSIFNLKYKSTPLEPLSDGKKGFKSIVVAGGISLSILCTGIAFRLLHLPGSIVNLSVGLASTSIVLLILILNTNFRDLYRNIIKRGLLLVGLAIILLVVPEIVRIKIQFSDHPEFIELYEQSISNPDDEELKEKVDLERHRITMSEEDFKNYQQFKQELKDNSGTLNNN